MPWEWLRSNCDHAGVISFDPDLASFQIGEDIEEDDIKLFGKRIENIGNEKYWIVDFVSYQYGNLKENYNPHRPALSSLKKHNLTSRLAQGFVKGSLTLIDKDKDKDKDIIKDKVKDKDKGDELELAENEKSIFDDVRQSWNSICAGKEKLKPSLGLKSETTKNFFSLLKLNPELKKVESWEKCFDAISKDPFLNGHNSGSSFVCTLNWLIDKEKIVDVLDGQFGGNKSNDDLYASLQERERTGTL